MTARRSCRTRVAAVALGALLLATMVPLGVPVAAANAAPFAVEEARANAPDAAEGDAFGQSVSISGNTLVVGAPAHDSYRGAVYVFVRSGTGWAYQATLHAPTQHVDDRFGSSVAIDGDWIVVGAPYYFGAKGAAGAAFTFKRSGTVWAAGVILPAELEAEGDRMGESVDIQGSTIVVGCPYRSSGRGAIRTFRWTGTQWTSDGGKIAEDTLFGSAGDHLGMCVAIGGSKIFASQPGADYDSYTNAGKLVVFNGSGTTWAIEDRLKPPTPVSEEQFGGPIDLTDDGSVAIVGRMLYDAPGNTDIGCAYLYTKEPGYWAVSTTLSNPGPNSPDGDNFGSAVAIDGDLAIVGAFWDDSHTGAAYYFQYRATGWNMVQKATPGGTLFSASFGDGVALDNGTAVVASRMASSPTVFGCGAVWVYNSRATITGICRSAVSGEPLAGVEVQAHYRDSGGDPSPASQFVTTGPDGRYTLSVDSGQCYVNHLGPTADWSPGWYNDVEPWAEASPITVWAGTSTTIDFSIYPKYSVFRFYNVQKGTHFFTNSLQEKKNVLATWPTIFRYEGISYISNPSANPQPLFRFYNRRSGSHFYTASADERDMVMRTWPDVFQYDGPTYQVSLTAPAGAPSKAVYRFYNMRNGSHFYTASETERDMIQATWPDVYRLEGIAFYIVG